MLARCTAEKVSGIWLVDDASLEQRLAQGVGRRGGWPRKGEGADEVRLTLMNREHAIAEAVHDARHGVFPPWVFRLTLIAPHSVW